MPLGGLGEIGMNCMLIEYEDEVLVIDCGLIFSDLDHFGVEFGIPDFTHLKERQDKISAFILTHGHEDHIGALAFALKAGIGVLGGVIDSQYRGEIVVIVTNHGAVNYRIEKGSKIAQILLQRVELLQAEEVDDLDTTFRGDGAFGSTGTH
jgi:ribonuclease J